jgi:hypothetical protein
MSEALTRAPTRRKANWRMRNARTGEYVTVQKTAHKASNATREIGRAFALPANAVTLMLDALKAASARSRTDGAPLQFTIEVDPSGEPRIVEAPAEAVVATEAEDGEALDAALAAARSRGRERVAEILAQPDMLSADDFADHLGTSRMTVNTKRQAHQVLGLQGATRGFRYPDWQLKDGRPFAALPALFAALGDSPWAVYRFLVQEHGELDGLTGRDALQRGLDQEAIEAAESVARAFA